MLCTIAGQPSKSSSSRTGQTFCRGQADTQSFFWQTTRNRSGWWPSCRKWLEQELLKIVTDLIVLAPLAEALAAVKPDGDAARSIPTPHSQPRMTAFVCCWSKPNRYKSMLLAQAGIDAKEREAADKLQRLILEELHHRIKNTLATVRRHRLAKSSDSNQHRACAASRSKAVSSRSDGRMTF